MKVVDIGQTLKGRHASYAIIKLLKQDGTVFQAHVKPDVQTPVSSAPILSVIKCKPEGARAITYVRERACYGVETITQSPYIRAQLDLIGHDAEPKKDSQPQCMVFEWMDTDLWQLPSEKYCSGSQLPRIVARSVLEALAVFQELDGVHTDVNPNNILVSGADTSNPVVKLGDLGNLIEGGRPMKQRYQGVHIRAPEVWRGIGVFHSTDIWGLGVTLAHWLASKTIFGPRDKIVEEDINEWCIAKITRLVVRLDNPEKAEYAEEFAMAEYLEKETFVHPETGLTEKFIKVGSIRQELMKIPGKKIDGACLDFIESLQILDHTKRPTAREALEHPWLKNSELNDID